MKLTHIFLLAALSACPTLYAQGLDADYKPRVIEKRKADPEDEEKAVQKLMAPEELYTIGNHFKKEYRRTSVSGFVIDNKDLTAEKITAFRSVFAAKPVTEKGGLEYADILMIPVRSTFRLDKALQLDAKKTDPATADFFYSQYGFQWRYLESGLKHYTLYLGRNKDYYFFGTSNLPFLVKVKKLLALKGGFSVEEYLSEALSVQDAEDRTAEEASVLLPESGNRALPYLKSSIQAITELDEGAYPHFRVLAKIATPEAFEMMNSYADDASLKYVLLPLFDAIISGKLINKQLLPCYYAMLREQVAITFAAEALAMLNLRTEARDRLRAVVREPQDFDSYKFATFLIFGMENPGVIPPHKIAEEEIRVLLVRGGDIPESTKFVNTRETETERELRLAKKDMERIKVHYDKLVLSPNKDLTMIMALELILTRIPRKDVSALYEQRLHAVGYKLLKDIPGQRLELTRLVKRLASDRNRNTAEREKFRAIAKRLGIY